MSLLTVRNMSKRFGGLTAVDDVSIAVNKGEIYGLIGPNGAGKTTCFNLITGLYPADSGEFSIADRPYFPKHIEKVTAAGIARTFQNVRLFNHMSVLENVMVGRHVRTRNGLWAALSRHKRAREEEKQTRELAWHWLEYTGIAKFAHYRACDLAYGHQRRLEIARALATDPLLLALDEPAAGMNAAEKVALGELLIRLRDDGKTLLMIEHDVKLVMGICDRLTVLDYGKTLASGTPESVRRDPAVIAAWLGATPMSELLKVERVDVHYGGIQAVRDVSFTLHEGEQATLIGANGAGKSSTVRAITGLESFSGRIEFNGKTVRKHRPETLLRDGLVMVPEGRGIFSRMTVLENLQMGAWLRRDAVTVKREMNEIFERFPRLGERQHQLAGLLSGGEQQLLALNRALLSRPRLLILDEPRWALHRRWSKTFLPSLPACASAALPCCSSNKTLVSRWKSPTARG